MTNQNKHAINPAVPITDESAKSVRARRRRAEDRAREMAAQLPENLKTLSPDEIQRTLHELRVSQIELELKNESLLQMQRALQAGESLLRTIIDNEPECIKIVDSQGFLKQMNPAGLAMIEADSPEQVVGHPLLDLVAPEYRNAFTAMHKRVIAGEAIQMEFEVIGLKGKHCWLETHAVPMQDNGEIVQLAITRDITERKQTECALQESNQSLREAQLIAGLGSYVLDISSGYWKSSSVLNKLLGISETYERTVEGWKALIHPDDCTIMGDYLKIEVLGQGKNFNKEYRIIRHDDHAIRWVHGLGRLEFDAQRHPVKLVGTIQDITERKLIEQELRHTQQELRGLSKAASVALEAERRRTARDLHDELGQLLVAVKIYLGSLCSVLPQNDPDIGLLTQEMHTILDMSITTTRRIASDLRPTILDDMGLAAALEWLTQNFFRQTGVEANLVFSDTAAHVPEPIASALYRITQESLTNVTKHAHATRVAISLKLDGDCIQLIIRDNGKGIETADQSKPGVFGLIGIRERVVLLSGETTINSEPNHGTEIQVRIPFPATPTR